MLYAIQAGPGGAIKIGFSGRPDQRIKEIAISCPQEIQPLGVQAGSQQEERGIHAALASHRIRGEWFAPDQPVLDFVATLDPWPWAQRKQRSSHLTNATPRKRRITTSDRVNADMPAAIVINGRFDGLTHFCQLTGYPTSTAHGWLTNGFIPNRWRGESTQPHIMRVAEENNIEMEAADFIEKPAPASPSSATLAAAEL